MKSKILKTMVLSGAIIAIFLMMRYNPFTSRAEKETENINPNNQKRRKKQSSQKTDDNVCPSLSDPRWKRIGKVQTMHIYPVKSSEIPVMPPLDSYDFFDYGMCKQYNGTYFYDGMFVLYNRTKDKFKDVRTYYLLENMTAHPSDQTENAEAILYDAARTLWDDAGNSVINLNIHHDRNPFSHFTKKTWNGEYVSFYGSSEQVNTWVKDVIQIDEDIILAQMIPSDFESTEKIRTNWDSFVKKYETMEEDNTGKLITLPRFVLMTQKTCNKLIDITTLITPNVIIDANKLNPFEEKNWNWIKIGENVILRNVKPVSRGNLNEEFQHRGIYCGLWTGGRVSNNDDVFIYSSNLSCKKKPELFHIKKNAVP